MGLQITNTGHRQSDAPTPGFGDDAIWRTSESQCKEEWSYASGATWCCPSCWVLMLIVDCSKLRMLSQRGLKKKLETQTNKHAAAAIRKYDVLRFLPATLNPPPWSPSNPCFFQGSRLLHSRPSTTRCLTLEPLITGADAAAVGGKTHTHKHINTNLNPPNNITMIMKKEKYSSTEQNSPRDA